MFYVSEEAIGEDTCAIVAAGDLDFAAAPELKRAIGERVEAGAQRLVLDLSAVDFIDSTAIGVVVGALKRIRESGGSLAVVGGKPNVQRIFEIVGMEQVIQLHSSREDALSALAGAA
jgi:anti-sigma B factor antagonist